MDVVSILKIACRALARNKMRSVLTMLGMIIGVGGVIAMVGLGQGAQEQVQAQIAAMGSNMLFVLPGSVNRGGMHMGWGATKTLVYGDKEAILRECQSVRDVAPLDMTQTQIVYNSDNWYTTVNGTEPQYFDIREWPLAEGAPFTKADVDASLNLAVIGETVRRNLFGSTDPVGQTIRIKNLPFTVVGVLARKGQGGMGNDQDDNIYVPLTTLQKKITGN